MALLLLFSLYQRFAANKKENKPNRADGTRPLFFHPWEQSVDLISATKKKHKITYTTHRVLTTEKTAKCESDSRTKGSVQTCCFCDVMICPRF